MKTIHKITSIAFACAILASITGCAQTAEPSEPVNTTSPIYVQEDEYQYGDNSEKETGENNNSKDKPDATSPTEPESGTKPENTKPHVISETEASTFTFPEDKFYNTSMKPNITDDVSFQVELIYTEDFYEEEPKLISSEVMPLDEKTTYADICNLNKFSLVTMDGDLSYALDYNGRFDYYGFMHTTANSPATFTLGNDTFNVKPTLNLELVGSDNQIVTNVNELNSAAEDIRVKAISAKSLSINISTEDQAHATPVMVAFKVFLPDTEPFVYQVGMSWLKVSGQLKEQGILPNDWKREDFCIGNGGDHIVIKNADYTMVFVKYGDVVDSISLIKN